MKNGPTGEGEAAISNMTADGSTPPKFPRKPRWRVTLPDGSGFDISGRGASALRTLARSPAGVTPLDLLRVTLRLAAYVEQWRNKRGLVIETVRERHEDGWHARYRLASRVTIHAVR